MTCIWCNELHQIFFIDFSCHSIPISLEYYSPSYCSSQRWWDSLWSPSSQTWCQLYQDTNIALVPQKLLWCFKCCLQLEVANMIATSLFHQFPSHEKGPLFSRNGPRLCQKVHFYKQKESTQMKVWLRTSESQNTALLWQKCWECCGEISFIVLGFHQRILFMRRYTPKHGSNAFEGYVPVI